VTVYQWGDDTGQPVRSILYCPVGCRWERFGLGRHHWEARIIGRNRWHVGWAWGHRKADTDRFRAVGQLWQAWQADD
jgi:hypothetical protein